MEAEEQDFIVFLLAIIAGKTLSKYPPSRSALPHSNSVCVWLGAPSIVSSPCQLYSPCCPAMTKARRHSFVPCRDPKRPCPLQHHSRMKYHSIPAWESHRAGAAAASQPSGQGAVWGCLGCLGSWGHPWLSLHVSTPRICIFQLIALILSA